MRCARWPSDAGAMAGHDQAAEAWQAIAVDRRAPAGIRREALEALAIHFEHRARDLVEARRFAQLSLAERVGTADDAGRPSPAGAAGSENERESARTPMYETRRRLWRTASGLRR